MIIVNVKKRQMIKKEDIDYKNKEINDEEEFVAILPTPLKEWDKEVVKEGKGLKILTPKKLLTKLPVLLAQIKAGNNPYKDINIIININIIQSL